MPFFLAALMLQAEVLPPETWKERHYPDVPAVPACRLGPGRPIGRIVDLPGDVQAELRRFYGPVGGMSDAGGMFNPTDVIDRSVPTRRFVRAYHVGSTWIIWYESGGGYHDLQTIALRPRPSDGGKGMTLTVEPGTSFTGNLCAASKGMLRGVKSHEP